MFVHLALRWNARLNLIASGDEGQIWRRHVEDSLQLVPLMPAGAALAIDIGSGGGFPGLVLAIATGCTFHLIESDRRKAAFLREAARITGAPARVFADRIEHLEMRAPLVTARAVAPLPRLLEWAHPRLLPGGACLFLKGRAAADELASAKPAWRMTVQCAPSITEQDARILRISNLRRR